MSPAIRQRFSLPLVVWVAGGMAVAVVAVLGVVAVVLSGEGMVRTEVSALVAGLVVGALATALATSWAVRVTAGLRELHNDAIRRLRDSRLRTEDASTRWEAVSASQELFDLARVLDALHLRARVADEVAEQSRRTAENASAGMFELLSGLVAAEEGTRGQLSAELHDTVAQSLMAARSLLSDSSVSEQQLALAREYVEEAEEQVRAVMARARPPELRDGDLASAVGALRRDMSHRYLLDVRFSWPDEAYPLSLVAAVTVYRFFQEALLNVVKHADVDHAEASLAVDGGEIVATVRDAGPGFVARQVHSAGGRQVGLGLLRERARLAGGSLDVDTKPQAGTVLTLRLPFASGGSLPVPEPTTPRRALQA
ncbi:MAG TPA: ATP-binding protein [Mycobacteriales bacterium]|nr:ATP-binding protein [Mycobacteriales bacterium]